MAGTFIKGVSKILSGVYTRIVATISSITTGSRGIVAYPFTSDWGPTNALTPRTLSEFEETYNAGRTTLTANKVYVHASKGSPSRIMAYRMATETAKKGICVLGADSLNLETLYPSARNFVAVVKDGVEDGTKTVEIVENGVKLVSVTGADNATLAALLNATDYVRVANAGTVLPTNTAGEPFSGGNNGDIVTTEEYNSFLAELEADGTANSFSLDGVTDDAIITMVETWLRRVRDDGFYVTFVNGGPSTWDASISEANARSVAFNYRAIVNVGNGCDGYTPADMAIFVAARIASVALNRTLTDETTQYTKVNKKLTIGQREAAKTKGTLVFVMNGDFVEIDEGVNTLTAPTGDESKEFGKIRVSNTLDYIVKDLEAFGNEYKKTKSNTDEARQCYAALVEDSYLRPLANDEIIRAGYFYRPDPEYHGKETVYKPKIDEAFFDGDITPVDSMERIYQKIGVNF
jgi:hypothetical protein